MTIAYPGTESNTVYVRYRPDDSQPWSDALIIQTTSTETVGVTLTCLSPGSSYEVEASLVEGFIAEQTVSKSFRTLLPRVSRVNIESKTSSQANIRISIDDAGLKPNAVYLRYKVSGDAQTVWTTMPAMSVTGDSADFEVTGLAPGTRYTVQASMESDFNSRVASVEFATVALPRLGGVNLVSLTKSTARIAVTIFDPNGTEVRVYMRYREIPAGSWGAALHAVSSIDRVEFELSGLEPGTEYEVEASLEPGFEAALTRLFITEEEVTRVDSLTPGRVTRSSAELEVEINNAKGRSTVYVRYRSLEVSGWKPLRTVSTSSRIARLILNNLEPDTLYEAEASLNSDFLSGETLYAIFMTEPGARLSAIDIENVTDTKATVVVNVERLEGRTPIHLRYRPYGIENWSDPVTSTTSNSTVSFSLTELLQGIEYEIEASLDLSFPRLKTIYQTFETDPAPEITSLRVSGITESGAKASVNIAGPQPRMTIYLRYRAEMEQAWSRVISKTAASRAASLLLEQLMPETMYEVQVSLHADFEKSETAFFTTEEMEPSVSGLEVKDVTEASATISLTISNSPGRVTVYVRYRKDGSSRWIKPVSRAVTTSNTSFALNNLMENTAYTIEASVEPSFPVQGRIQSNFRTRSMLRVSDVAVNRITETNAQISIKLSGLYETKGAMHIRYRELPNGKWKGSRIRLEGAESTVLISELLPGTEYLAQASIEEAFAETHTRSEKFRTLAPEQVIAPVVTPVVRTADAAPREFSFAMPKNKPSPDRSRLGIWSSAPAADMEVSIKEDIKWLIVEPEAGLTVNTGELLIIELRVDASGLGAGVYTGEIEIVGNAENLPLHIPVTLTITNLTPTPEPTVRSMPMGDLTLLPQPTFTPEPTAYVVATPPIVPLENPTLSPSPIPTPEELYTPTIAPMPTVPMNRLPASEPASSPLPTPTATPELSAVTEGNDGLSALRLALVVLAAICIPVVGFLIVRRSASL